MNLQDQAGRLFPKLLRFQEVHLDQRVQAVHSHLVDQKDLANLVHQD